MSGEERLISLFYLSSDEPDVAFSQAMRRLHSDRAAERFGTSVLTAMTADLSGEALLSYIISFGVDVMQTALRLKSLLNSEFRELSRLNEIIECARPTRLADLAIDGGMLLALGYKGERVGELLRSALLAVMRGEVENDRREILHFISSEGGRDNGI